MSMKDRPLQFMKYCFIILIAACCIPSVCAADMQPVEAWNQTYQYGVYTDLYAVVQTGDGGYLAGGMQYPGGSEGALLLRLDEAGDVEWSRLYPGMYVRAILPTGDGRYLLASEMTEILYGESGNVTETSGSSHLIEIDGTGNVIWTRDFDGTRISALLSRNDGGYLIAGWKWIPDTAVKGYLAAVDPEGSVQWEKACGNDAIHDAAAAPGGGYLLAGATAFTPGQMADGYLAGVDDSGEILWSKTMQGYAIFAISPMTDDKYLIAGGTWTIESYQGNAWFGTISGDGEVLCITPAEGTAIYDTANVAEDTYALAGKWGTSFPQLQIADGECNVLSKVVYSGWDGRLNAIGATDNGGFIACGWSRLTGEVEGWVIRYAPYGSAASPTASPGFSFLLSAGTLAAAVLWLGRRR